MGFERVRRGVIAMLVAVLTAAGAVVAMGAQAGAVTACQVTLTENLWSTGFTVSVAIKNLGDPWTSWELRFGYGGNERLAVGWSGGWSQDGRNITVRSQPWNSAVGTGQSVVTGAQFHYTGSHVPPTSFILNGVLCNQPPGSTPSTSPAPKLDNPYADGQVYVNPEWAARAAAEPGGSAVAGQPTFVWLDEVADIAGTDTGLRDHLDTALAQSATVVQLAVHNLPGRDCQRRSPDGELGPDELPRYKTEFIDPIAEILADPRYRPLRIVTVVEVGALASLVINTGSRWGSTSACDTMLANGGYVRGIGYALARLGAVPNVYTYLDAGHHGSLGWDDNFGPALSLARQAATSEGSTLGHVHGFIVNATNYSAMTEPYFSIDDVINGTSVRQSRWVDWNRFIDERPFALAWRDRATAAGFTSAAILIDTSRNGWGGHGRPTGPGPRTSVDAYVDGSRLDRRVYTVNWCNQSGAGLGERPQVVGADGIEAFVWAKPPGESDGTGDRSSERFEVWCDPLGDFGTASNRPTGALPGAPERGEWFSAHFRQLLQNAYPPLG
jgi:cellulose 1,4-beta-cellobiosidase